MDDTPNLLIVVGPTASGKTELALRIAERCNGEVINADSVQVYRHFDIGSGKPSKADLRRAPYHLLDFLDPLESIDASVFAQHADRCIAEIRSRKRTPIVCGGTFLWVRALVYGLAEAPPKDDRIREHHERFVEQHGRAALHEQLRSVDPASFERLNPNDFVRVSRALEVHELTGKPLSDLQAQHGFRTARYPHRYLGIRHEPKALAERIRARAAQMLDRGWRDEVRKLLELGYGSARPMHSVGYRQVLSALQSSERPSEEGLLDEIARATRLFARRQRTWLRDEPVRWLTPAEAEQCDGLAEFVEPVTRY